MRRHIRESLKDALAAFDRQLSVQAPQGQATGLAEAMDELVTLLTGEQHVIEARPEEEPPAKAIHPSQLRSAAS